MIEDFVLCLKNQENITTDYSVMQSAFLDNLYDSLNGLRKQFNLTFQNYDMEDYVKSFFLDENNKIFISSDFIDENQFYHTLIDTFEEYFNIFLGISLKDKENDIDGSLSVIDKFNKIYYNSYLNLVLTQRFIEQIFYLSFSNLTSRQISQIESLLNKKIDRTETKKISKRYKLKSNNYIMDLQSILINKESVVDIIKNTSIFDKNLFNMIYYKEDMPKNYIYELIIRLSSKYDLESLFKNLLKNDENLNILINRVEVYAMNKNFSYNIYDELESE